MEQQQGKVCSKCGMWKPLEEFSKQKKGKLGRKAKCKECCREYGRKHYQNNLETYAKKREENRDKMREYAKKHYEENKEYYKKVHKEYKEENKIKLREYRKRYEENNKEEINKKRRTRYKQNREMILMKKKKYQERNKDKIKIYYKRYQTENKEKIKEYGKEYRQLIKDENLKSIIKLLKEINSKILELELPVYGSIYKITNTKTNKTYIGQTVMPLNRRYENNIIKGWIKERMGKVNQKFKEELNNEEDFEIIEVLDVGICKFHLNKLECYYINKYDSYYNGYNNNNGHYMDNEGINEFEKILKEYNLEFIDNELRKIND